MQILVQSSSRKLCLKIVCLFWLLAYTGVSVRDYVAYHLAGSQQSEAIERAITLDPSNAKYHHSLGSYFMFSAHRPDQAIPFYKAAVELNPYVARYWLDLASAYQFTGAPEKQRVALEQAIKVDPNSPRITWEAANSFLAQGERQKAFRQFRQLFKTDETRVQAALQVCWRATHDADELSDALLPKPKVYFQFLNLLVGEQETRPAKSVWSRLVALNQQFDPRAAMPYVSYLITQQEVSPAQRAWKDLSQIIPSFRGYLPHDGNLIVNGGFEENILNGGFDWRYQIVSSVRLVLDTSKFHSGSHSFSATFNGEPVSDIGLTQLISVNPDTGYWFSSYVKTDTIFAASGPQFVISDVSNSNPLLYSEELMGTSEWKEITGEFKTGPATNLITLRILRPPGAGRIAGKLWIDDVSVRLKK